MDAQTEKMREFFDRCAGGWDVSRRGDPRKIAALVTLAGVRKGSRVLDIACGTGVLFPEILSRDPALLLGVDLSGRMIEKARSKFHDPRLRLAALDFFNVRESGFDTAFLFCAYPHFPDKARLCEQMAAVLKPGGRMMVAHDMGRGAVNRCHGGEAVGRLSWALRPVREEAARFSGRFRIDMAADTGEIYFFSGVKKQQST